MRVRAAAVLAASLLLTSCSSTAPDTAPPPPAPEPTSTVAAPRFDPPRDFESRGKQVGRSPFAVVGDAVVSRDPDREQPTLTVIGLDGTPRKEIPLDFPKRAKVSAPYALADGSLVLLAVAQTVAGTGTNKDRVRYTVTAYDPKSGTKVWERPVDATDDVPLPEEQPRIVGADRDTVVVTAELLKEAATIVLSTVDGSVRWSKPRVTGVGLDNGVVVGYRYGSGILTEAVGFAATDGSQRWVGQKFDGKPSSNFSPARLAGAKLAIFSGIPAGSLSKTVTHLVDTASGTSKLTLDGPWKCQFDATSVVVCGQNFYGTALTGFDATSLTKLWELPDKAAGREAPLLHAVHRGVAYVSSAHGLMTLDTRSGKDLDPQLTKIQDLYDVVPGYAIGVTSGKVWAHRAVR